MSEVLGALWELSPLLVWAPLMLTGGVVAAIIIPDRPTLRVRIRVDHHHYVHHGHIERDRPGAITHVVVDGELVTPPAALPPAPRALTTGQEGP